MTMATSEHKRKVAAQAGIYLLVVAAIVVVVNLLASKMYSRWDVTKTERYTLSQGSGRLLSTLNSPIQVDAYVKTGLPQLDAFVRDLTDLLKEYERAGKGKFKFTVIEPNTDELRTQATEAGVTAQPFGEASATGEHQRDLLGRPARLRRQDARSTRQLRPADHCRGTRRHGHRTHGDLRADPLSIAVRRTR